MAAPDFLSAIQREEARIDDMRFELVEGGESRRTLEMNSEMRFDLASWSFEDYTNALQYTEIYQSVMGVFPEDVNGEADKINELVDRKYCVAGGNARLMFTVSTDNAVDSLDNEIHGVRNARDANGLLAIHLRGDGGWYRDYYCLVSAYVARKFAVSHGFEMLRRIASRCNVNTMDEWLFEGWFLSELSRQGIEYVEEGLDQLGGQWGQSDVLFFDPTKATIGMRLDRPTWLTPVQWNQGGFDAVFVDKPNALVRFVQVTRADHHSYDHRHFVELLGKLAVHDDWKDVQLKKVQLYFVVPREKLSVFRRPVQSADFQKIFKAHFPRRRQQQRLLEHSWTSCCKIARLR
ncbi:hypothetical protein PR001_g29955 [Phytophthora rubi]|uniref:Uncharacterized protein n=1 Tax=Phytophthora rubi TaxID=129364 RepID=A0A6A3GXX7_9STRA|nr:hypothetical protein PR001_g29955 [Phytophthora rubi]